MKRILIIIFLFITGSVSVWGQDEQITFDISQGNVIFTDRTYSQVNNNNTIIKEGNHKSDNKYIVSGTTTEYFIRVGNAGETNFVTGKFTICLNGADIRRSGKDGCAFGVYNKGESIVAVILKDGTNNILYSGYNSAGLEKSGGASANGTLLITCEKGYEEWLKDNNHGHTAGTYNESACGTSCGHLDARSGNAWYSVSNNTYPKFRRHIAI